MDEVKIWAVNGASNVVPLESKGETESEWLLEQILVENPNLLIPGLRLVGRQTPTGGGPLDLLGVDEDGRLVVFELKRGTLSRDAVAQIIDYASDLDSKGEVALAEHIAAHSGVDGIEEIEDFQEWYSRDFGELVSLKPLRLFLIGLGADERTERMVRFLAENSGMDISLLTFHGFEYDGKMLLARQTEVEGATEPERRSTRGYIRVGERRERLQSHVEDSGVSELVGYVEDMFRQNWPASSTDPGLYSFSIRLQRRAYARVDVWKGGVTIVFYAQTKALCLEEFRQPVEEIRHETWPRNRESLEDPDTEIHFKLTADDWETDKERLHALTRAVYKAWESANREGVSV